MKNKTNFLLLPLLFMGVFLFFAISCDKDDDNGQENSPVLSTTEVTEITANTATSGGNITDDGGATVTARGVCWSTNENPTIDDNKTEDDTGAGSFTSSITDLEPNTTYYLRAYATNSAGNSYGSAMSFTTLEEGTDAVDADGNVYETLVIGDQEWMAENLKTTTYNDGTDIPNVADGADWSELETGAYAWYDNDASNKDVYGALYNWYAVETGNLCPDGWRVPTDEEWTQLTDYLGGEDVAGGKLKATGTIEAGTGLWYDPNTDATNETGFTALPGGYRSDYGTFYLISDTGTWWSATEYSTSYALFRIMGCNYSDVNRYDTLKELGFSVRCLRD